ncbi:MAG: DinB family protein [Chloroflexi bacterium]|nr:DinB family protein [Chloroflexota bacterium]
MQELIEYREKLIARMREATVELCEFCKSFQTPFEKAAGEWTVHQTAFHVRDVMREVYGLRIRRTLNEENPGFKNFDPDAWMAEHYNRSEAMEKILSEFSEDMLEVCAILARIPQEGWSRVSCHEALGSELTLQLWAERSLAHIEEHLDTLKNKKKTEC